MMTTDDLLEISVEVDAEAAEAVSELFNRYNGGGYDTDSESGEAAGGGAVIETTGYDDFHQPIASEHRIVVKTYIKPGPRGAEIRRQIEEGIWRLSLIYPLPEPQIHAIRDEDWAHAWKKFYKPLRIGQRVVLTPTWETWEAGPDDLVVELDPGMAFGTGLHPSTRLCVAALEGLVRPGDALLDVGAGSGVLSIVAAKLGATRILATDIDTLAVRVARENAVLNKLELESGQIEIRQGSVPSAENGAFRIVVANILAETLADLLDGRHGDPSLAEPVSPGGYLILAGILDEKASLVIDAGARFGLELVNQTQESDWVAIVLQKPE